MPQLRELFRAHSTPLSIHFHVKLDLLNTSVKEISKCHGNCSIRIFYKASATSAQSAQSRGLDHTPSPLL